MLQEVYAIYESLEESRELECMLQKSTMSEKERENGSIIQMSKEELMELLAE